MLHEAVSNLDARSEQELRAAIDAARTTLLVAHRLSTIAASDRIVMLDRGAVVETGTHRALLAQDGAYRRLVSGQDGRAEA